MSNEIELKLAVTSQFADKFSQSLQNLSILEQQKVFLGNTYYDTANGDFASRKMGLRVRSENGKFQMTVKTDGKVTGGLHVRPEYNVDLDKDQPDWAKLQTFSELDLPPESPLLPIFSTDFERQSWLIQQGESQIEVALDRGEIKANGNLEPICEVEFEIKRGEISDLFALVENLLQQDGVRLSSASKAKRGYQLASGRLPELTDWIAKWREFLQLEQTAENPQDILTALLGYEQALIEETMRFSPDYFAQDFMRTVERVGAFFNLAHYYSEEKKLFSALAEQAQADEPFMEAVMNSHEWFFTQIYDIIRLHSSTKDNALAMQKLNALLHQADYAKRLIRFIQLTVA